MLAALVVAVNFLRRYWQGLEWLDRLTLIVIGVFTLGAIVLFAKFLVGKVRKPMKLASPVIDSAPDKTTVTAPRLLVYYVDSGRHGQLMFKSDKPTIIRGVGPLVSAERYGSQHEFSLSPSTPPPVDKDGPVECKIYGLRRPTYAGMYSPDICSLLELLGRGSPQTVDSVVIDYDDEDGNEFSRRFALTRGEDNSIAWIPDPINLRGQTQTVEPSVQELMDLRHKLALAIKFPDEHAAWEQCARRLNEQQDKTNKLLASRQKAEIAGAFGLLAREAEDMLNYLKIVRVQLDKDLDASELAATAYPLRELPEKREDRIKWSSTHVHMLRFQHQYRQHRMNVMKERCDTGFTSGVTEYPVSPTDSNSAEQVAKMLSDHAQALHHQAAKLIEPFCVSATTS